MKRIAVVGLGAMGLPIAQNLISRGYDVLGSDLVDSALDALNAAGGRGVAPMELDLADREVVVTSLPEGRHVRGVYEDRIFPSSPAGTLLIDCSTIDVDTTRSLAQAARERDLAMIDAPISGGPEAAAAGKLSFMVGGEDASVRRAMPLLEQMGAKFVHFGESGSGQAAKACHNMICGITAMAVCEGFALSQALGLDAEKFHALCRGAAAQSWVLENRCPIPGVVPEAPSSHDYAPGFAAGLMAKDLRLAQMAAQSSGQSTPFGAEAARTFTEYAESGEAALDFSAFYRTLRPSAE